MICKKALKKFFIVPKFSVLLGALATLAIPSISLAQSYNAAADFDAVNNFPVATSWSYGYTTTLGGSFNLFGSRFQTVPGLDSWAIVFDPYPNNYPRVVHNGTTSSLNWSGVVVNPGVLLLHPGPMNEYAVVRWRASDTGRYSINFTYTGLQTGVTTDVHLLKNNFALFNDFINGFGDTESKNEVLLLNAGDTIDFAVGYGNNGNFNSDVTRLDAQITKLN